MDSKRVHRTQNPPEPSSIISLQGDKVIWHNEDLVFSTFNLLDVVAIGEYTTASGSWFDDWFLVFVKNDGSWNKVSYYANNIEELIEYLSSKFDPDLEVSVLAESTSWKSVVRYPVVLKGKQLFERVPSDCYNPPRNLLQKYLHAFGIGKFDTSMKIALSEEVRDFISKEP